jgi:hypothetical protein
MKRLAFLPLTLACTSGTSASSPSGGTYTITFPSTAAAVASDSVQVLVFDAGKDSASVEDLCPNLVLMRKNNQQLPPRLLEVPPASPCDLLGGSGTMTIPYGSHALLAVAEREGKDFLIGCAIENVTQNSELSPIDLTLVDDQSTVPATTCAQLSAFCQNKC